MKEGQDKKSLKIDYNKFAQLQIFSRGMIELDSDKAASFNTHIC